MTAESSSPPNSSPSSGKPDPLEPRHEADATAALGPDDPPRAKADEPNEEENLDHTYATAGPSLLPSYAHVLTSNSRWWMIASAFPMIAGTLGPVASAFSICALGRPWRQYAPPGTDIQTAMSVTDPPWYAALPPKNVAY